MVAPEGIEILRKALLFITVMGNRTVDRYRNVDFHPELLPLNVPLERFPVNELLKLVFAGGSDDAVVTPMLDGTGWLIEGAFVADSRWPKVMGDVFSDICPVIGENSYFNVDWDEGYFELENHGGEAIVADSTFGVGEAA